MENEPKRNWTKILLISGGVVVVAVILLIVIISLAVGGTNIEDREDDNPYSGLDYTVERSQSLLKVTLKQSLSSIYDGPKVTEDL